MPTVSKIRRLDKAADLYIQHAVVAHKLCEVIKHMHPIIEFPEDWTQEQKDWMTEMFKMQDATIKKILMPFVEALEKLDKEIRENLPNQSRIITPDEIQ